MSNGAIIANLRNTLAYLYPDDASARRVAADAGLDITSITIRPTG